MRCTFGYSLKQIAVASLFSCFVAGGICVLTSPSAANNAAAVTISVNRTFKGDRLPQVPIAQQSEQNSTSTENSAVTEAHSARLRAGLQPGH